MMAFAVNVWVQNLHDLNGTICVIKGNNAQLSRQCALIGALSQILDTF